jgi:hypothetical protein
MSPACLNCTTKKISFIETHLKEDNIITGFTIDPCTTVEGIEVDAERLGYCIKKYRKLNPTEEPTYA